METVRINAFSMILIAAVLAVAATATMEDDVKDCADLMAEMAACIPYVSGGAKQPTKECCDDADKVRTAKPKCLCVLIKESTDPSIGLPINTTLALQMPAACNSDAKISDCPSLLNLPADSPDAKIFKVASEDSSTNSTTTSPSGSSKSPSSSSSSSSPATTSDNTKTSSVSANGGAKSVNSILPAMALTSMSLLLI